MQNDNVKCYNCPCYIYYPLDEDTGRPYNYCSKIDVENFDPTEAILFLNDECYFKEDIIDDTSIGEKY